MAVNTRWHWLGSMLFLASFVFATPTRAETVRVAIGEYPPFKVQAALGGGALTEIVAEALKARNLDISIEWVPNNRAIVGTMNGTYEASFGWAHNDERDAALLYSSKPIYVYRMVFVQHIDKPVAWASLADLAHKRIGFTRGNFYSQALADMQSQKLIASEITVGDVSGLKMLALKRIDLFPLEASVARFLIATELDLETARQLEIQNQMFWSVPIFFVVSKKAPNAQELMNEFNKGYEELFRTKRIESLEKKLTR
ncbi:substrate-binding periplasmic protein [Roseateles oligotrophus]|uniref:Transporter substrate-binding domain-containing protein n=1 Tax=Roseateles oligotrophus TaxID=1769250 RepID=A0ABT2YMG3_9BURK|nr:transporter substrate-binding domain-containing protein [Roseateles oligotrophus]MCV2371241.1 transporter substrate-binding domain-containing protein [Roseateles oligotrophus]